MAWIWRKNGILILLLYGQKISNPLCDHPLINETSCVDDINTSNLRHIRRMSYVHVTYNSKTTKVCHLIIENSDDYHQIANNFLNAKKTFDLPNGYYYFFYKGLPKEEKKKWDKKFKSIQTYKMLSEKKGKKK